MESEFDHLPAEPVRQMLAGMRADGLRWTQVEGASGIDRRVLSRILAGKQEFVRRSTAERVAKAQREFSSVPVARTHRALLIEADVSRWKVRSLMAQGYPTAWFTERTGVEGLSQLVQRSPLLQAKTVAAVDRVFEEAHARWGPNRRTAVRMWRAGHFPVACYDWDQPVPDLRPIPGSLRPDLVREALAFTAAHTRQVRSTQRRLALLGQWPHERCAEKAMNVWLAAQGEDVEVRPCTMGRRHPHDLPDIWAETLAA